MGLIVTKSPCSFLGGCWKQPSAFLPGSERHQGSGFPGRLPQVVDQSTIFFFYWSSYKVCGILVPQPGPEPSANHWTTREVPKFYFGMQLSHRPRAVQSVRDGTFPPTVGKDSQTFLVVDALMILRRTGVRDFIELLSMGVCSVFLSPWHWGAGCGGRTQVRGRLIHHLGVPVVSMTLPCWC